MQAFIDALWNWATDQIPIVGGALVAAAMTWLAKRQALKSAAASAALDAEKAHGSGKGEAKLKAATEDLSKTWGGKLSTRKTITDALEVHGMAAVKKASEPPPPAGPAD